MQRDLECDRQLGRRPGPGIRYLELDHPVGYGAYAGEDKHTSKCLWYKASHIVHLEETQRRIAIDFPELVMIILFVHNYSIRSNRHAILTSSA